MFRSGRPIQVSQSDVCAIELHRPVKLLVFDVSQDVFTITYCRTICGANTKTITFLDQIELTRAPTAALTLRWSAYTGSIRANSVNLSHQNSNCPRIMVMNVYNLRGCPDFERYDF